MGYMSRDESDGGNMHSHVCGSVEDRDFLHYHGSGDRKGGGAVQGIGLSGGHGFRLVGVNDTPESSSVGDVVNVVELASGFLPDVSLAKLGHVVVPEAIRLRRVLLKKKKKGLQEPN